MGVVYLDCAAHGPIRPSVLDGIIDATRRWGVNPHNRSHASGRAAAEAFDDGCERISAIVGGCGSELTLTSGATESNNLAIFGVAHRTNRRRIVTVVTEHASVLAPIEQLEDFHGFEVTALEVDRWGRIDLEQALREIDERVALVSIMLANHEVATLHDLAPIGAHCRQLGVPLHSDLTQAVGRVPVDVRDLSLDLATFSSHKLHGPVGVGALWVHPEMQLETLFHGGNPGRRLRPGTPNLPGAMGFAVACDEARERLEERPDELRRLTERLASGLERAAGSIRVSPIEDAVPGIVNVAVPGVDSGELLDACPEVIAATGSACTDHSVSLSPVIEALDLPRHLRLSCVRLSPGWFTREDEIDRAVDCLAAAVDQIRERNGLHSSERELQQ